MKPDDITPEKLHVVAAAIISHDGEVISMPRPARHHNIIRHMVGTLGHEAPIVGEQGFVLSDGRFCRRKPAGRIAVKAGQTTALKWPPNLYSEDLW